MQPRGRADGGRPAEQPGLTRTRPPLRCSASTSSPSASPSRASWGLGDEVLHMIRRLPPDAPVRKPDTDADLLRIVAQRGQRGRRRRRAQLPAQACRARAGAFAERYARVLRLTTRILRDALAAKARAATKKASVSCTESNAADLKSRVRDSERRPARRSRVTACPDDRSSRCCLVRLTSMQPQKAGVGPECCGGQARSGRTRPDGRPRPAAPRRSRQPSAPMPPRACDRSARAMAADRAQAGWSAAWLESVERASPTLAAARRGLGSRAILHARRR